MTVRPQFFPFEISGRGGGKSGGGGSEAANTLKSRQTAKVVDVLSEGPIRGVVGGYKGVYLDGVVLQNNDGTLNFTDAIVQFVNGYPDQPVMTGFNGAQAETSVGQQLLYGTPLVRSILNTDTDRARVTVSVPSLQSADSKGNINGTSVSFRIEVQTNGGGYRSYGDFTISGKTSSKYQRAISFLLPSPGTWDIRLTRLTAASDSSTLQNDLYWDSYTAIIDDKINYTLTAAVGVIIDSKQFSSIPKRTYLTDGILCQIPSNYDPDAGTYDGVWDGTFKTDWTNNPAWVLYDIVTKGRYGIGDFISTSQVNKWSLYKIAQWCDGLVPNGNGAMERRYLCNIQIMDQQEAFDLLNAIAGIYRGFIYWDGSQMVSVADQPADPVMLFTNANVVDGNFEYSGSDVRARHTMAQVGWKDPNLLAQPRIANIEVSPDLISTFGLQKTEYEAVGCTRESQAIRSGNWTLYTEQYEGETCMHKAGLDSAYLSPGSIYQVSDIIVSGSRRGGRVAAGSTTTQVNFDATLTDTSYGSTAYVSCIIGEGNVESKPIFEFSGDGMSVITSSPFSEAPLPDTVWIVSESANLLPTLWRTISVKQTASDQYEISGVRHFPQKWDYVENNLAFADPIISNIQTIPALPTGLSIIEYLEVLSPISVGVRGTLSWVSTAPRFSVAYRITDGNWNYVSTDAQAIDIPLTEGDWQFNVTPVSMIGQRGPTATLLQTINGRFAAPAKPENFRLNVVDGVALFEWTPSDELDVRIGGHFELRHTSDTGTGATWISGQAIIPTIPGTASSAETTYRVGTWFLRTFDATGLPSSEWASIIAENADERFVEYVRICESPAWLGDHYNTEIRYPEEWLTLGFTGGLWDAQTTTMDTWPDVFILDDPDNSSNSAERGVYTFYNRIDAGAVFPIRFSTDILAFAFQEPDSFFDSRLDNSDDWADWDETGDNLAGAINLEIRTTDDDPDDLGATWTEWQPFTSGTVTARAFEFRAILTAPPGQNIGVETLCIIADFREKIDHGDDVTYAAADTTVPFTIKFFLVPSVVITIQDAEPGDTAEIIAKSREDFTVRITNGGAQVNRTFDWHAMGY